MQISTITYPAELKPVFSRHPSRKERLAAEHLKDAYRNLLNEAEQIHIVLQTAENHFNYLSEENEIDACIYRIRTAQCRYASALSRMQELQVRMNNLLKES